MSSGEVSGDHYTACIAKELRKNGYRGELWGMGGRESKEAGVRCAWNGEQLQLLGVVEVLRAIPSLFKLRDEIVHEILQRSPSVVLVADSPDFHMPLISGLRKNGYKGKVVYISPPSVWAWRSRRAEALAQWVDLCLPLFRFEHDYLSEHGCKSFWKGHPLVEEFSAEAEEDAQLKVFASEGKLVALLPGSRRSEIQSLFPLLSVVYKGLEAEGWLPVFSVAPGLNSDAAEGLNRLLEEGHYRSYCGRGRDLMAASAAVVGSSGTATVEAMLLERYMVIVYKVHPVTALIGRLLLHNRFFGIPNLLAGEEFFPEFVQDRAQPDAVLKAVLGWLNGSIEEREQIKMKMKILAQSMGTPGVYADWVREILKLSGESQSDEADHV